MPNKNNLSTHPRPWLRYLLATGLLAILIVIVPVADIWAVLRSSKLIPLGFAALTIPAARLLGAMRTKVLTDHQGISFSLMSLFHISCASTFYSMLLPGSFSGGIIRWYRLSRPQCGHSEAFAVLLAERVVDFFVLALWGLLCLAAEKPNHQLPVVIWGLAAAACICLSVSMAMLFDVGTPLVRFLQRHTHQSRWIPDAILVWRRRLGTAIVQFKNLGARKAIAIFSISLLFHAVASGTFYLMAMSLELDLTFASIGWLRAATIFLTAVPLSPSGVGVREFSLIYLLLPFGVSASQAVAFSFLQYAGLLFVALTGAFMDFRRYLRVPLKPSKHTLEPK